MVERVDEEWKPRDDSDTAARWMRVERKRCHTQAYRDGDGEQVHMRVC